MTFEDENSGQSEEEEKESITLDVHDSVVGAESELTEDTNG